MKILVLDKLHLVFEEEMKQAGCLVDVMFGISTTELENVIADYEAIVVNSREQIDKRIIDLGIKLKAIGRPGSGTDNIDVVYAESKGIAVINSPEGNCDAVAEHVIGMLLMLFNKLNIANDEVKNDIWKREENTGIELGGKTLGIIGYGHVGQALAKKLSGFDVSILAYDKYKKGFGNSTVIESSLQQIFEQADIVSLHVPLTNDTRNMANNIFFNSFKKNIFFANSSRGQAVDLDALKEAIQSGKVLGTCLDVFEKEPLDELKKTKKETIDYFIKNDRTLMSPHIAGWTAQAKYKMAKVLAQKFKKKLIIN